MTRRAPRLLLLFCDDSTLIFCARMADLLIEADRSAQITFAAYAPESALSDRQLRQYLPQGNYEMLDAAGLTAALMNGAYDAILTSRVFRPLDRLLGNPLYRQKSGRARVVSFLGGLDFSPGRGMRNRRHCDIVYLFPRKTCEKFRATYAQPETEGLAEWPIVGFGHPAFLMPRSAPDKALDPAGDIYFFAQALSPSTARARRHMLEVMAAIARRNPERTVWIKLRHLPNENTRHLHRERHDYPGLAAACTDLPGNLRLTARTMGQALSNASLGITCTSTAAIDLVREGVPAMVHLDYPDRTLDPLVEPMRRLFTGSNLIKSLDDVLNLRFDAPDRDWLSGIFCPRDLGRDVLSRIADATLQPPDPFEKNNRILSTY